MGVQHINTRLKNKIDYLAEWQDSSLTLLNGEIALVRVDTGNTITNPITGKDEPDFDILMKVGDGEKSFGSLPWLSAKAADVYDWAKEQTAGAVDVVVTTSAESNKTRTLSEWIAKAVNATITNSGEIAKKANSADVYTSAATNAKIQNDITVALNALSHTSSGSGSFVTDVTQSNGKVTVTKGNITASNLPDISSDKVKVGSDTLTTKLTGIGETLALKANSADVYTKTAADTAAQTKITQALANLSHGSSGSGSFVTNVTQSNGKVTVTKGNLPSANASTAGIATLGATGGAATYESIFGETGLQKSVATNAQDISDLKSAISGGTHFRGVATEAPTGSTYKIGSTSKDAVEGDIVIFGEKEYIYTGSGTGKGWKELGDLSRVTTLETWKGKLQKTDSAETNKFVTNVGIAADGTVTVGKARPTAADISYGTNSDVKTTLDNLGANKANASEVYTKTQTNSAITTALDALDLTAPTATDNANNPIAFIDSVSQANGQLSATKKTIRAATTGVTGIVKLSSSISSSSEDLAATPKAVKAAYDKAVTAENTATGIGTRLGTVESNYVRFADDKLYVGASGADVIIFDCGGATETILPEAAAASYSMNMTTPAVSSGSDGVLEVPNGNADDLTGVEINGEAVDPSNYSVQ